MIAGILLTLGLTATAQEAHKPAVLVIKAVDAETGALVKLSSAELYIDVWGGADPELLPVRSNEVRVPLGRDRLCSSMPPWCGKQSVAGRITVRAAGYAAVASDLFPWIGSYEKDARFGILLDHPTGVVFPGQGFRTVRPGSVQSITLRFHRLKARQLLVVDDRGIPIADAWVTVHETQARTNHCGAPEGTERVRAKTNVSGRVRLPGDDVEWTIEVGKAHHQFVPGRVSKSERCVTRIEGRLPAGTTTAVLRRLEPRPLALDFRNRDGSPAVVEVRVTSGSCGCCGACDGPLGKSDASGRFVKLDFYPDEWSEVFVSGTKPGERRWTIDPRKERWSGTKIVVLR